MTYFVIFLLRGNVVYIASHDEEDTRNATLDRFTTQARVDGIEYDELQALDMVR